jgi:hypothetical protein
LLHGLPLSGLNYRRAANAESEPAHDAHRSLHVEAACVTVSFHGTVTSYREEASEALWPEKFDTIQDFTAKIIRIAFLGN